MNTQKIDDSFKDSLNILEKRLLDESIEPSSDLKIALTWFEFVQRIDTNINTLSYFISEWLPKYVKAFLHRKIDWNKSDYNMFVTFVEEVLKFIAKYLYADYEILYGLLKDLLDPNHSFYTKYCVLKNSSGTLFNASRSRSQYLEEPLLSFAAIEVGDFIDWKNDQGIWEVVGIENISEFRTEFEISLPNETKQWLSVDANIYRIAPFFTKSTTNDNTVIQLPSQEVVDLTKDSSGRTMYPTTTTATSLAPIFYGPALPNIQQGVDATDYSHCDIMKQITPNHNSLGSQGAVQDVTETSREFTDWKDGLSVGDLIDCCDRNQDWYQACILDIKTIEVQKNESSQSVHIIDFTAEDEDSESKSMHLSHSNTTELAQKPKMKKLFRIAYLGLPESCDEWIDTDTQSIRIQGLNICSNGRKGYMNAVRDEILFLVKPVSLSVEDTTIHAVYREGCFMLPLYVQLVNVFGAAGGFNRILDILQHIDVGKTSSFVPGCQDRLLPYTPNILNLIACIGAMHRILAKPFLASFGVSFLETSIALLMNLSLPCLRETSIEMLEISFTSLENLAFSHFGRNKEAGRMIEPVILQVALQNLESPYLNRRLGGLKILCELVKKARNILECPSGIKVITSMSNNMESISYKVFPILYHYNLSSLSEKLKNNLEPLLQIFIGNNAHESLMTRASPIICVMANQNCLDGRLLQVMWEAGLHIAGEDNPAWKCLSTVLGCVQVTCLQIPFLISNIDHRIVDNNMLDQSNVSHNYDIYQLLLNIQNQTPSNVSIGILEIVLAIALRCRTLLQDMIILQQDNDVYQSQSHYFQATLQAIREYDNTISSNANKSSCCCSISNEFFIVVNNPFQDFIEFQTYRQAVNILWYWIQDDSNVSDDVVEAVLTKIDTLFPIYKPTSPTTVIALTIEYLEQNNEDNPYLEVLSYTLHWFLMNDMLISAVEMLKTHQKVIIPSLKIIQSVLYAWPIVSTTTTLEGQTGSSTKTNDDEMINNIFADCDSIKENISKKGYIRNKVPNRSSLVNYLENEYQLIDVITLNALKIKSLFYQHYPMHSAISEVGQCNNIDTINKMKIKGTRHEYILQLERLLDFCLFFIRCDEVNKLLGISCESICLLWNAIMNQTSTTLREVNILINFLNLLVSNASFQRSKTSSITISKRSSLCSRDTIEYVFSNLLCRNEDRKNSSIIFNSDHCFLSSIFFSVDAYDCIEKWFRWLNCNAEVDPSYYYNDLNKLIGVDVFTDIIFICPIEVVAKRAVKFITSLPLTLYQHNDSIKKNVLSKFSNDLLICCMTELTNIYDKLTINITANHTKYLSRVLLLLDGILEQSNATSIYDIDYYYPPHGCFTRGEQVIFKVACISKRMKHLEGQIVLSMTDTIDKLMQAVAKQVRSPVSNIKVFRGGKEISICNDGFRLISHSNAMIALNKAGNTTDTSTAYEETIYVVEKNKVHSSPTTTTTTTTHITTNNHQDQHTVVLEAMNDVVDHFDPCPIDYPCSMDIQPKPIIHEHDLSDPTSVYPPGCVLSKTKQYFDLLFLLLRSSSEEGICDRIFTLLTKIPSCHEILSLWLSLPTTTVGELLLNFNMQDWSNLSLLLYNLQIIHMLLQPAISSIELIKQMKISKYIDVKLLDTWIDRFLEKQGIHALCKSYEWLATALQAYMNTPSGNILLKGVTPQLFLNSFALISKILKAFWIRASSACSMRSLLILSNVLREISSSRLLLRSDNSIDEPTSTQMMSILLKYPTDTDIEVINAIHKEWGWRMNMISTRNFLYDHTNELNINEINFSSSILQRYLHGINNLIDYVDVIISSISLLKRFSELSYFNETSENNIATQRTSSLMAVLESQLVIMTSVSLLQQVQSNINHETQVLISKDKCEFIVERLLIVNKNNQNKSPKIHMLSLQLSNWFVQAIALFIVSLSTALESDEMIISSRSLIYSGIDNFNQQLFFSLLKYRPSAAVYHKLDRFDLYTDEQHHHNLPYKYVFALLRILLTGPTAQYMQITDSIKNDLFINIMNEFDSIIQILNTNSLSIDSFKSHQQVICYNISFPYLEDTLMLVFTMFTGSEEIFSNKNFEQHRSELMKFLLHHCLALVKYGDHFYPQLCRVDSVASKYAYKLLKELVRYDSSLANQVVEYLHTKIHIDLPVLSTWDYRPEKEIRSVGINYVGLRNLGCTCYMNSLLQVLFMNERIREYILNNINFDLETLDELKNNIAFQLKRMFYVLKYSYKKSYSPVDWAFAFKDEFGINPVDVMQQQDAQEFLQQLAERFENNINQINMRFKVISIEQNSNTTCEDQDLPKVIDILQTTLGGKFCNQMFKLSSSNNNNNNNTELDNINQREVREHFENYVCISVEVKGYVGLESSLKKLVEGETITDFVWEVGQPRESIIKRQCIAELNDTIFFHLKRFELNFDTFRREKVNDSFTFPLTIDMFPYTKQGLEAMEKDVNQETKDKPYDETRYKYELSGVIIHMGTSNSGHYFSYIRQNNESTSVYHRDTTITTTSANSSSNNATVWYEFNDSEVTTVSEALVQSECFGGSSTTHEYINATQKLVTNQTINKKSAYMLVYNRIPINNTSIKNEINNEHIQHNNMQQQIPAVQEMSKLKDVVELENKNQVALMKCLSSSHLQFNIDLIECLQSHANENQMVVSNEVMISMISFIFNHMSHSCHSQCTIDACSIIFNYLREHKSLYSIHRSMSNHINYNHDHLPPPPPPLKDYRSCINNKTCVSKSYDDNTNIDTKNNGMILSNSLLSIWENDILMISNLIYTPKEDVQQSVVSIIVIIFELHCMNYFFVNALNLVDISSDLISTSGITHTNLTTASLISSMNPGDNNHNILFNNDHELMLDDDPDLALAIKMSQETVDTSIADPSPHYMVAPSTATAQDIAVDIVSSTSSITSNEEMYSVLFLRSLTTDKQMQLISEHWRTCRAYIKLLYTIASIGPSQKEFFIKREMIAQIVDIILSEQSPLIGQVYLLGTRCRAPSSYVSIIPTGIKNELPYVTKNIPDWTNLLELLVLLIAHSKSTAMVDNDIPLSIVMGDMNAQCIQTKLFYLTIIKQARYIPSMIAIVQYLAIENKIFSDIIAETIHEEMSMATFESLYHLFTLIEAFLTITDSISYHRAFSLFGSTGSFSLLELMKSYMNEQFRYKLVGVFIRSFISLMQNIMSFTPPHHKNLSTITSTTNASTIVDTATLPSQHIIINDIHKWSPWMLKFCYRFHQEQVPMTIATPIHDHRANHPELHTVSNEMKKSILHSTDNNYSTSSSINKTKIANHVSFDFSNETIVHSPEGVLIDSLNTVPSVDTSNIATSTIPATTNARDIRGITMMKGSYLKVYGESIHECEITWQERAQCTSQLLHTFILNLGHDPNALIPTDTFSIEIKHDGVVVVDDDDIPELIDDSNTNISSNTSVNNYNPYYSNNPSNNSQHSSYANTQPPPYYVVKHKYSSPGRSLSYVDDHSSHTTITSATSSSSSNHTITGSSATLFSSANKKPKNQEHHHSITNTTNNNTINNATSSSMDKNDEFVVQQLADGMTDEELAQLLQDGGLSSEID